MNKIIEYYSGFDEWGRLEREPLEFIINSYYIKKYLPVTGEVLDNGAGPGKYAMELAKLGLCVTLTDITPKHIRIAREKACELGLTEKFHGFHVLNATHLKGIADEQFDVSLMLGPLYHLQEEGERAAALEELYRVTKPNGVVFIAVQSRMRMVINSLQSPSQWRPNDNLDAIQTFFSDGVFNHKDEGRFTGAYYFHLEEVVPYMENKGFETLELIGSSSFAATLSEGQMQHWRDQGEYEKLLDLLIQTANDSSILGISSHLLYIGRKP
ncbi:methyltransferase domain-containing protein [Paenibacillus albidus]|uniref:class I SAM-dependent methyltransferase n=1 Tax=Paenibacillus albidus TaxID=2041023 RepID=UPI001BE56884|nr:class I SAM-dependent methyltransferase [Paenibacillus albidus]MBT2291119.1 methyltransferase domain-containing protein [Paenibacillus albidus]